MTPYLCNSDYDNFEIVHYYSQYKKRKALKYVYNDNVSKDSVNYKVETSYLHYNTIYNRWICKKKM